MAGYRLRREKRGSRAKRGNRFWEALRAILPEGIALWSINPSGQLINEKDLAWIRKQEPDVAQLIAGVLAGYDMDEVAAARQWDHERLASVLMKAEIAIKKRSTA